MDVGYKQEVTVGLLVVLGVLVFIAGGIWLQGGSLFGDKDKYWKIRFDHAGTLKKSSVVRISGVPKGKVQDIELDATRKALVWISLEDEIQPRTDALAQVVSVGLVGDAAIDLDPGTAPQPL